MVLLAAAGGWLASRGRTPADIAYPVPGERFPYAVEVLNATGIDGLARDVTMRLRQRGIDVVGFGSSTQEAPDTTALLVRRGDSAAAGAVREALGFGKIVWQPDAHLLLDVTVLLGRDAVAAVRQP